MSWLDELKVDDEVFVLTRTRALGKISKVTTKFLLVGRTYFNKSNGQASESYSVWENMPTLGQVTPESKALFLEQCASDWKIFWVKTHFDSFNNEQLTKIYDLLHQPKGEENE